MRRLLAGVFELEEHAVHVPADLRWDELPARSALQLHWPPVPSFVGELREHGFHAVVLVRHPLDTLISILHFAPHEPQTACWLDGAFGDERAILGAEPCSSEFVDYAVGPRARALIGVSSEWSIRQDVTLVRYEDLVSAPARELQRIVESSGVGAVNEPKAVIEALSFRRMQREVDNEHFWQGQPGLWRRLLAGDFARAASGPYRKHAERHGYDLTPDPTLTLQAAKSVWSALIARR